ncbi:MAG TPA: SPW repeat protein [Planctomycetota bacterium]|nr:SPW repeat protein [Planctomycetota bacterium]
MRFIPTRVHGVLDYIMGLALMAAPWLFRFNNNGPEMWIPVGLGAFVILYSLITDYEWGVAQGISMPAHLWLDGLGGLFLAASPWLFGFEDRVYLPHLIFGLGEFAAAMLTQTVPTRHPRFSFRERHV